VWNGSSLPQQLSFGIQQHVKRAFSWHCRKTIVDVVGTAENNCRSSLHCQKPLFALPKTNVEVVGNAENLLLMFFALPRTHY